MLLETMHREMDGEGQERQHPAPWAILTPELRAWLDTRNGRWHERRGLAHGTPEYRTRTLRKPYRTATAETERWTQPTMNLECALWFRTDARARKAAEEEVQAAIEADGGEWVTASDIDETAYHVALIRLPADRVRALRDDAAATGLGTCEALMTIEPQLVAVAQ